MSKLHYFQRYNSKENWVTNSTLLLLSRLYHYNRLKFENLMNAILTEDNKLPLNIGVKFTQQEWGKDSVVDGVISQESFKIVIETKLYDNFSSDQLIRHLNTLGGVHSQKILLALSKNKVSYDIRNEIIETLKKDRYKDIKFASTTYEDLYQIMLDNLSDYDLEMREILEDYISLCHENGLTNLENKTMLVFTASESLIENFKYRIYYDPTTRNHNSLFKYIGLYKNKTIVGVGELIKVVSCNYENNKLIATHDGDILKLTGEEEERIIETIKNTHYYDLKQGNKFFLVDNFYKTTCSTSSIRAKKYFRLDKEIEEFKDGMTAEQVANLLDGKTWK